MRIFSNIPYHQSHLLFVVPSVLREHICKDRNQQPRIVQEQQRQTWFSFRT